MADLPAYTPSDQQAYDALIEALKTAPSIAVKQSLLLAAQAKGCAPKDIGHAALISGLVSEALASVPDAMKARLGEDWAARAAAAEASHEAKAERPERPEVLPRDLFFPKR